MNEHKVLLAGPVGAGKTTAVRALSSKAVISTDVAASDMTLNRKETTTVAMDYGVYDVGEEERIHLYGTPGQERFSFMWDILSNKANGLVVLIDNSREQPLQDMDYFLKIFQPFVDKCRIVVGVTRMDQSPTPSINDYCDELARQGLTLPVYAADARQCEDVMTLVHAAIDAPNLQALDKKAACV